MLTPSPWLLMGLLMGMGVVWAVSPTIEVLPFEFPGIRPREVAVIASLVKTLSGLGFAVGPVVTGVVTQYTGSLQTGCLTLCGLTSVGIIAGLLYPSSRPSAGAASGVQTILFRGVLVHGRLYRLSLTLLADEGEDLTIQTAAFVPEPDEAEDWGDMPCLLGCTGAWNACDLRSIRAPNGSTLVLP